VTFETFKQETMIDPKNSLSIGNLPFNVDMVINKAYSKNNIDIYYYKEPHF